MAISNENGKIVVDFGKHCKHLGAAVLEIKIVNIINFVTAKMSQEAKNNKKHSRFTPANASKLDNMLLK